MDFILSPKGKNITDRDVIFGKKNSKKHIQTFIDWLKESYKFSPTGK